MTVIHEFKVRISSDKPSENPRIIEEQIYLAIEQWKKENGLSSSDDQFSALGIDVVTMPAKPLIQPKYPFVITDPQKEALFAKWCQNQEDRTFQEFVDTIQLTSHMNGAIVVKWCNMFLAIEKDGHTHS